MNKFLICLAIVSIMAISFASKTTEMQEGFARAFAEHQSTLSITDKAYLEKVQEGTIKPPTKQTLVDMVFCIESANLKMDSIRQATMNDQLAVYYYLGGEHGLPLVVIQRHWGDYKLNSPNTAKQFYSNRCPVLEGYGND